MTELIILGVVVLLSIVLMVWMKISRKKFDRKLAEINEEIAGIMGLKDSEIHKGAMNGNREKVFTLLREDPDLIDERDEEDNTPLHTACLFGHIEVVRILLKNNADVNAVSSETGKAPLHMAASNGDLQIARMLVDRGAEINIEDNEGVSPLIEAADKGHGYIVELLVSKGAVYDSSDRKGRTLEQIAEGAALREAIRIREIDRVQYHLKNNPDLIHTKDKDGLSLLHIACLTFIEETELVKMLLEKGANVNARDDRGTVPIQLAAMTGKEKVFDFLLAHNADPLVCNESNVSSLHTSSLTANKHIAKKLISLGCNVNEKDLGGFTPLHNAVIAGSEELVEMLIASGADVNAGNREGETPLILAKQAGSTEIAQLLVKHGAHD